MGIKRRIAKHLLDGQRYARWLGVKVGDDCRILSDNFGSEPFLIEIGNNVTVSTGVVFLTHDGATWLLRDHQGRKHSYARIRIANHVFIGRGAILMPGIEIGDWVVIGAGSVVTKSVPPRCVVAGNPAKYICSFDEYAARPYASESQKVGSTYKERVLSIVNEAKKPPLC